LLHASDRIALRLQQAPDAAQQLKVRRPVVAASAAPLHRLKLGKLRLPKTQHVLLDAQFLRHFADVAKCLHCLWQATTPIDCKCLNLRSYYSAALRRPSPSLMRSFMMLLGRKTSTRRGVIGTSWPVLGFRPTRSPFWRMLNDPKDDSLTASPSASRSESTLI